MRAANLPIIFLADKCCACLSLRYGCADGEDREGEMERWRGGGGGTEGMWLRPGCEADRSWSGRMWPGWRTHHWLALTSCIMWEPTCTHTDTHCILYGPHWNNRIFGHRGTCRPGIYPAIIRFCGYIIVPALAAIYMSCKTPIAQTAWENTPSSSITKLKKT